MPYPLNSGPHSTAKKSCGSYPGLWEFAVHDIDGIVFRKNGNIVINENGKLILENSATVTANGLEMNRKGDCVFIGEGSELILN